MTLSEGTLQLRGQGSMGNTTKKLIINGGRLSNVGAQGLTLANPIEIGGDFGLTSANTMTLNGTMDLGGATRTLTADGNGTKSITGAISNGGLIVNQSGGTLALSGPNTYTGTTTVQSGTLQINGTHTGGGLITVASGAMLQGTGSAGDARIQSGGTLAPGNSVGEFTLGDLTLDGGATLAWEFDGVGGVDELNLNGLWQGTGTGWTFDFLNTGPGSMGSTTLIRFDANQTDFQTGDFTVSNLTLDLGQSGSIVVNGSAGQLVLSVIPEPASLGMLGILVVAGVLRRRLRS